MASLRLLSLPLICALTACAPTTMTEKADPSAPATGATEAAKAAPAVAEAPADPYLWLEGVEDEKALAWVRERNEITKSRLATTPVFGEVESRLKTILDSADRIPYINKIGDHYYNFWRDAKQVRGVWRRTSLTSYQQAEPTWETVIDLDALAAAESENWVWRGANCLKPEYRRCLVSLSRGGADATVVREFDMQTRQFLADGFQLAESKGGVQWIDENHLYVGTDFGPGSMTNSGYPRIAKRWARGTPISAAETVWEAKPEDVWLYAGRDDTPGFERDFVYRGMTFYTNEVYLKTGETWTKIDKPDDANASTWREWLMLELRSDWTPAGTRYAAGSLIAVKLDAFMQGERRFDVLFEPGERTSLAAFTTTKSHVVLNTLDNVRNRITVLTPGAGGWTRSTLPGLPEFGTLGVSAVDSDDSDAYFLTVTDYLTPTSLRYGEIGGGEPQLLKQQPAYFKAEGLTVSQYEATSADGTKIPYFQVYRKDLALDGRNPTLLYGYGGFEVSMLPSYSASVGTGWLERGGVYVVANIRGGGEFGPKWHQAALKANRNKAYEDFIAVAEDLIRRGVTSTPHLGIQGGSNGGLLMGNMLTMRPDLFGAIVCQVPLLDMRRYHTLLAGASWMGEYGNPDDPAEWSFIQRYSPYHNVREGVAYPPILITTSTRDDRVHPGHARKMAALLEARGQPVQYYENIEGGHGGAANNAQQAYMNALAYSFLWEQLKR
jgi:prolyl oligopeptidase